VRISPGLAPDGQGRWGPVHDYYVVFWRQPRIPESDLHPGATQEMQMWAAYEHYVREADDVHQVISWAEEEGRRRRAMYTLYAVIPTGDGEGLVWLAGVNPTDTQTNFERRHPVDVDPVSGTPAEVYRSLEDG
jgi:hypothetical protein